MRYWLVKSEPETYSWQTFVKEGRAVWDGVRNYQARNFLKAMKKGDQVFFYHSNVGKEVVGVAEVAKESYPDPTTKESGWVAVDFIPKKELDRPVSLEMIRRSPALKKMLLVRHSRLSVMPLAETEFSTIFSFSKSP